MTSSRNCWPRKMRMVRRREAEPPHGHLRHLIFGTACFAILMVSIDGTDYCLISGMSGALNFIGAEKVKRDSGEEVFVATVDGAPGASRTPAR